MEMDKARQPVATVTGLFRSTFEGLEPLTRDTPLTLEEVRQCPIFFELELDPDLEDADIIIDVCYDNLTPIWLKDRERGTDIPRGVQFWPYWFEIPYYRLMRDIDGRRVYPSAPGSHRVRIRTARRKIGQWGNVRDFSPANHGYTSPVFEITIEPGEDDF